MSFWKYMHEKVEVERHFQWFGWFASVYFVIDILTRIFG